jgi:hypothetical protein
MLQGTLSPIVAMAAKFRGVAVAHIEPQMRVEYLCCGDDTIRGVAEG